MSQQAMVTIVAPVAIDRIPALRQAIGEQLGNPAGDGFGAAIEQGRPFLHFASLHALGHSDGRRGSLLLELSADGDERDAVAELARRAGALLQPILAQASDWQPGSDVAAYLQAHRIKIGWGLFDTPGLAFSGTPGQSVAAIRREAALAHAVSTLLAGIAPDEPPLRKLAEVRRALAASPDQSWALEPPPPGDTPKRPPTLADRLGATVPSFVTTFLWPLLLLLVPLGLWLAWPRAWAWQVGAGALLAVKQLLGVAAATLGLVVAFTLAILVAAWLAFRKQEGSDPVSTRAPDPAELREMVARENATGLAHNHMVSVTVRKPGLLRTVTTRLAFWAVGRLNALNPRPGHLGEIGTIHFARWVTIPGTRDLVFFSNFGGSWESYLEDFITRAHAGLTAVWSNTVGFPRTRNLFQGGATDGERFKRYARQSMLHTPFWYSAYPSLTTSNIRANARIRRGVALALTEADAVDWLADFGSAPRPPGKLESTQIQSLVFGGMGFKPAGRLLVIDLGEDGARNREWLAGVLPRVAFNDGRYATEPALVSFAASARGLARLGLDDDTVASFPAAFTQGMHAPGRDRILGDLDGNARDGWQWGGEGNDVALLVYGDAPADVDALAAELTARTEAAGGRVCFAQDLTDAGGRLADRREPFGFVDGVSQPAMRGTYRGLRNDDPIHLVEPGEFVLGYPDNRGNIPPAPMMPARADPGLRLPIAGEAHGYPATTAENPRLPGHNGSFLVIRQLEQHVGAFKQFCEEEGARLRGAFPDLPLLAEDMADYVGAKMIGRWQDGSSLVRNPYLSATRLKQVTGRDAGKSAARPASNPTQPAAAITAPDARPEPPASVADAEAITPDNDFLFGTEDPQGLRCPYGSHVRRANPRESLDPGSNEQIDISNRHRIFRVGRGYPGADGKTAGLMFMCLNGDIERQFEFIQQTWMGSTKFHGLTGEADPIAGRGLADDCGFTIPTRRGPVGLNGLPQFVTMRGGGYFFLPGRQLLRYLAAER